MKPHLPAVLIIIAAVASTPAFAQNTGTVYNLGFSYDYYSFREAWGGVPAIQTFWGAGVTVGDPGKISGTRDGVTASLGFNRVSFDLGFLKGDKAIFLPVTVGTAKYSDRVKLEDDIYDFRFRYNYSNRVFFTAGYYQQDTDQTYSYTPASNPTATPTAVSALSGAIGMKYLSLGMGFNWDGQMGTSKWYYAFKLQFTGLAGNAKTRKSTVANAAPSTDNEGIFGGRSAASLRFSYLVSDGFTVAVEGGVDTRGFASGTGVIGDQSYGSFGRGAVQFRF
jgi:hypothetical protein